MSKTLSFDFTAVELKESPGVDKKGKPVTWVNFNIEPFVAAIMVEIAKANGYHVPTDGLGWSCRARMKGLGMGAGFVKAAKPVEKPVETGAANKELMAQLEAIKAENKELMAFIRSQMAQSKPSEAPVGTTITRKRKTGT